MYLGVADDALVVVVVVITGTSLLVDASLDDNHLGRSG